MYNDYIIHLRKRNVSDMDTDNEGINVRLKSEATADAFVSLGNIINKAQFSREYFGKSQSWFSQRLNGSTLRSRSMTFKEPEFHRIAEAFRDIAEKLNGHADRIDSAGKV